MKILTTSLLVALAIPASADILTLKDGTKLDATILSKTLEEYELEVNVTKSIKERRTIKRSEVVDIERVNQSDTIFEEEIAGLAPAPAYLALADYDKRIKKLKSFLLAHKLTSAGTKASGILKDLETERALIAAGGLKTSMEEDGIITAEEREENALEIDAEVAAAQFKNLVESRSYLAALRQYDDLELKFFGTQAHRDAVPLMARLANAYADLLAREYNGFDEREERRLASLERLPANDQQRAMQAEQQRKLSFDRLWEKEEKEGQNWFTVDTQNASSLEEAIQSLEKEAKRLTAVQSDLSQTEDTGKLYREGWIAAGEKNKEVLEPILDAMDEAGVPESYVNKLIDRYDPNINNPPAEEGAEDVDGEEEAAEEETETTE